MLRESGLGSNVEELHITGLPQDAFAFKLDHEPDGRVTRTCPNCETPLACIPRTCPNCKTPLARNPKHCFKQLSYYLNSKNADGINKKCDLIILWHDQGKACALLFELKSGNPQGARAQLDNSKLFLDYVQALAKFHYGSEGELEVKKAIGVADPREQNKPYIHRANSSHEAEDEYHVQPLYPERNKVAYIPIKELY